MRRMYSEQELTNVIKEVFDAEIASGAFDEKVSDAVDAYLVEHPVDVTALEGQDVELNSLDATGLITGDEIIEKMSGYGILPQTDTDYTIENVYAGIVKNGNKLTLVYAFNITKHTGAQNKQLNVAYFVVPSAVGAKLYPSVVGGYNFLANVNIDCFNTYDESISQKAYLGKSSNTELPVIIITDNNMVAETKYYCRMEFTFLLSNSLLPQE